MLTDVETPDTMRGSFMVLPSVLSIVISLVLIPEGTCVRIVGGHEVIPHSRPYMVQLIHDKKDICAGALIAENWVLTAAHCNVNKAILGAHSKTKKEQETQTISIEKPFPYPYYDKRTKEGDLQLLQLRKKATINKNVSILHLPQKGNDIKPGTMCQVAGWGKVGSKLPSSDVLREVNITVIDRKVCNDENHYNLNPEIGLNMICAGSLRGGKDTCFGDSGSPLLCDGVFRGIASFGPKGKCGDPRGPGVYTLLSKIYLQWIKNTMKKAV